MIQNASTQRCCWHGTATSAAVPSHSSRTAAAAHIFRIRQLCGRKIAVWPRRGPSLPTARSCQPRCPLTTASSSAAAAPAPPAQQHPSARQAWPRLRTLAITACCAVAWVYLASSIQSSSLFAAISLKFRAAAQTGETSSFGRRSCTIAPRVIAGLRTSVIEFSVYSSLPVRTASTPPYGAVVAPANAVILLCLVTRCHSFGDFFHSRCLSIVYHSLQACVVR